jgi:hypothetical protein
VFSERLNARTANVVHKKLQEGEIMLKKFLALSMILGSMTFAVISAEAKTATENLSSAVELNAAPQWQRNRNRNRRMNNRVRVVNTTRIVRVGRRVFRETIQTRYMANGRTTTRVISRVRVR